MLHYKQIKKGNKFMYRNIYGQLVPCKVAGKSICDFGGRCYQVRVEYTDEFYKRNTNEHAAIILSKDGKYDNKLIPAQ